MTPGLIDGALQAIALHHLLLLFLGAALGIVFGAIPGLTATMGLALLVPFTFTMEPAAGLLMLAGIYVGAMYGDAVPAILINTPGTPAAIATTFDGYPLAQKGMAQHALVTAAFASCIGSLVANVVLATSAEPLADMALKFGPAEYFWLGVFGLTIISVLSSGSLLKGFVAGAIGLLFSTVGMATLSGDVRLTFDFPELQGGIGLAGALIGFFCLPEILSNVIGGRREHVSAKRVRPSAAVIVDTVVDLVRRPVLLLRSSIIGLVVGIAPGAGGNIASMVSYSEATRWEPDNEEFGKGTIRGVAASEAANSAMAPGSLIPLLTLGIPGSPPAAIILGALLLHGMKPGTELFSAHASATYAFIVGLAIAAVAVLVLGVLGSFVYARIVNISSRSLAPAILLMTVLGSFAIRNNMLDVWVMLLFGALGFILSRLNYHPAPLVLGFILGPYIEDGIVQSTMIGGASGSVLAYMALRPISMVLIALCLISALWPIVARRLKAAEEQPAPASGPAPRAGVNADLIVGLATLAVAAIAYLNTRDLSHFGGLFVDFCATALAVLGLLTTAKSWLKPEHARFFASAAEGRRVLAGIGILALYLLLIPYAGFLLASVCFYFVMHTSLRPEPDAAGALAASAGLALAVTASLYLLFQHLLGVPLPPGIWG